LFGVLVNKSFKQTARRAAAQLRRKPETGMRRVVQIVEFDPAWPAAYAAEASAIRQALGPLLHQCFHVGSTAIPAMAAKPVIDILLSVQSVASLDAHNEVLRRLGYESLGEYGFPGRRFFQKGGDRRTHHLHAFDVGSAEIERHVLFRDYLRANAEEANAYMALKQALAQTHRGDPDAYTEAKGKFILGIDAKARQWSRQVRASNSLGATG